MKAVTYCVSIALFIFYFGGMVSAQQYQEPRIFLDADEKCNNYMRHFCLNGSHEASVNRALLELKKKGYKITPRTIQKVARSTPSRMQNPASQVVVTQ